MNEAERLARIAASLMSENGENPEYDRAAVEIISDFVGIDMDKRDDVTALLRFIGQNPGALVILNWITGYDG